MTDSSTLQVLNHRHRMAQMAGRSSVELYTNMFFKNKTLVEEGRVIRILKNGFVVLVPRYISLYDHATYSYIIAYGFNSLQIWH